MRYGAGRATAKIRKKIFVAPGWPRFEIWDPELDSGKANDWPARGWGSPLWQLLSSSLRSSVRCFLVTCRRLLPGGDDAVSCLPYPTCDESFFTMPS